MIQCGSTCCMHLVYLHLLEPYRTTQVQYCSIACYVFPCACCFRLTRPMIELAWTKGKVIAISSPAQGSYWGQEATELAVLQIEKSLLKLAVGRKVGTKGFLRLTSCCVAKCCLQDPSPNAEHLQQGSSTGRVPFQTLNRQVH